MFELHLGADLAELVGAVSASVVSEQGSDGHVALGEEVPRLSQEPGRRFGLLVGEQAGEGEARVVVDGDVQRAEARMLALAAQPTIAAQDYYKSR